MTIIRYPSSSPYSATPQLSWRIGRYVHRAIPRASDDSLIVVQPRHAGRPDNLAYDLYGSPAYWWVFTAMNPKLRLDPIRAMTAGMTLTVPSRERLLRLIGE